MGIEVGEAERNPRGQVLELEPGTPPQVSDVNLAQQQALQSAQRVLDSQFGTPLLEDKSVERQLTSGDKGNAKVSKALGNYAAALDLMENFHMYSGGEKSISKTGLEKLSRTNPELKNTIDYALTNFDKLSGGNASGISRDGLKQPLVQSLTDAVKTDLQGGNLSPEVQAAVASWVTLPDQKVATYLEQKLNDNMKDSGYRFSIKPGSAKGLYGDLPAANISLTNDITGDKQEFSYTADMSGASGLSGKYTEKGLLLLDKQQGPMPEVGKNLKEFDDLHKLQGMFQSHLADSNSNGFISASELARSVESSTKLNGKDEASGAQYAQEHFDQLSAAPQGNAVSISLNNVHEIEKQHPELKEDLEFLEKALSQQGRRLSGGNELSLTAIKKMIEVSNEQQRSPLSTEWSEYFGNVNRQRDERRDEERVKQIALSEGLSTNFEDLSKKLGIGDNELSGTRLKKLDSSKIEDKELREAVKALQEYARSRGDLTLEGIQKAAGEQYVSEADRKVLDYFSSKDNFAKLKTLTDPPAGSLSVSKLEEGGAEAFAMDRDSDGFLTKAEIDSYTEAMKKEQEQDVESRKREKELFDRAAQRFASITENFSKLASATGGDKPGISLEKVREAKLNAIAESIIASTKQNGAKMPADLQDALAAMVGAPGGQEQTKQLQQLLNEKIAKSGYKVDISVEQLSGPHGDTVRGTTVTLSNVNRPTEKGSFSYYYDTVRGQGDGPEGREGRYGGTIISN